MSDLIMAENAALVRDVECVTRERDEARAEVAQLKADQQAEQDGRLAIRARHSARESETMPAFVARVVEERDSLRAEVERQRERTRRIAIALRELSPGPHPGPMNAEDYLPLVSGEIDRLRARLAAVEGELGAACLKCSDGVLSALLGGMCGDCSRALAPAPAEPPPVCKNVLCDEPATTPDGFCGWCAKHCVEPPAVAGPMRVIVDGVDPTQHPSASEPCGSCRGKGHFDRTDCKPCGPGPNSRACMDYGGSGRFVP
jgi:hypothetical protein